MPISDYKIVVARYSEDVQWIKDNKFIFDNAIIYNKGKPLSSDFNQIMIPNDPVYAREADSILNFIIDNYENLPSYTIFTQGDPFDHSSDFIPLIRHIIDNNLIRDYQPLTYCWKLSENIPPSKNILYDTREYVDNYPIYMETINEEMVPIGFYDPGIQPILHSFRVFHKITDKKYTLKYVFNTLPLNKPYVGFVKFNYGAIFGVSKENILKNDIAFYKNLKLFNKIHPSHVFILERLWYTIFGK